MFAGIFQLAETTVVDGAEARGVTFAGRTEIRGCTFRSDLNMHSAHVTGSLSTKDTKALKDVRLTDTLFDSPPDLAGLQIKQRLTLAGAVFSGGHSAPVLLRGDRPKRCRLKDGGIVELDCATVDLQRAEFSQATTLTGRARRRQSADCAVADQCGLCNERFRL